MEVNDAARTVVPFGDGRSNRGGGDPSVGFSRNRRHAVDSGSARVLSFDAGKRRRDLAMQGISFNKVLVVALGVIVGMSVARMLGVSRFLGGVAAAA
jgi:hypothetical protein